MAQANVGSPLGRLTGREWVRMSRICNPVARRSSLPHQLSVALLAFVSTAVSRLFAATPTPSPLPPRVVQRGPLGLFDTIWKYELFHVGEHVIQVNQVVLAAAILFLGLLLSRLITRWLRTHLLMRVRLDPTAAATVEKLLFYLLLVMVLAVAFQSLHIPITVFAFVGGALAIGIGFGAQNIINNFISGLILMLERPVRIGDLVEVQEHRGRIEEIRFRCTRVRRNDGVEVLVPNSALLEKEVINWTLSDKQARTSITVGVVYGSPTDQVADLIRKAVEEHERVLKYPAPTLVFDDFGDNSLVFEVFFWTEVATMMDLRTIRSDIRFRIDSLFREAGIVIAFPQRDVHLDTSGPLEVRLQSPQDSNSSSSKNSPKPLSP